MQKGKHTYVVGISAFYHDAACCILVDDQLVAAAEEERFTRKKHDPSLPVNAFRYCLEEAGVTIDQIDCLAFYENPYEKFSRQIWSNIFNGSWAHALAYNPNRITKEIREKLGYENEIKIFGHHLSHAASSYYYSGFNEAAILTVDGVGEWATTTYGMAQGKSIKIFEQVDFPDSLGLLYSTITSYLGFKVNGGEYKVMGLAPYGAPTYMDQLWKLIELKEKGQYRMNMKYFDYINGGRMFSDELFSLLGHPPRIPGEPVNTFHCDLAKSIQEILESILLHKVNYLYGQTGTANLCLAGGVALNCVANSRILKDGPFRKMFIQPAANDAGGALGAAALANLALHTEYEAPVKKLEHVYLGPSFSHDEIAKVLQATGLPFINMRSDIKSLYCQTASRLAEGKVVGWFQGRMEFGPRSLGNRAILANPRDPLMRDKINSLVKKREAFRPFAPVVLQEKAQHYFALDHPSPYMLETCSVISHEPLPAVTHEDNSARVQTVSRATNERLACLLQEFERITGIPVLLNTSFNVNKEPIVCSVEDAVKCFIMARLDCLVIGDFLVDRTTSGFSELESILEADMYLSDEETQKNIYSFL